MIEDYIFCPLCGGVKWIVDKTGTSGEGRLTFHKCTACKKFTYTNEIVLIKNGVLVGVTNTVRFSVVAEVYPYTISVYYKENKTDFRDVDTMKLILSLNKAIQFNWYREQEVIEKIKKYLVFS